MYIGFYASVYKKQKAASLGHLWLARFLEILLHDPINSINCLRKFEMVYTAAYNWKNIDGVHPPDKNIQKCWPEFPKKAEDSSPNICQSTVQFNVENRNLGDHQSFRCSVNGLYPKRPRYSSWGGRYKQAPGLFQAMKLQVVMVPWRHRQWLSTLKPKCWLWSRRGGTLVSPSCSQSLWASHPSPIKWREY